MRTIIFFREGLSGNYLKSLIDDSDESVKFRMDPWKPGTYDKLEFDESINCICTHKNLVEVDKLIKPSDLVLTIQVREKIYHAIYNNFNKKFLIENPHLQKDFDCWQKNLSFWYDNTFYNIKEYYNLYQQDLIENQFENIVEFDKILELDYIEYLFDLYYKKPITQNTIRIVEGYKSLQLQYQLDKRGQDMQEIISVLPDQAFLDSPWFASYCIFKYETNNHLEESQRQWSVNDIARPIDKQFLLSIADKYQL